MLRFRNSPLFQADNETSGGGTTKQDGNDSHGDATGKKGGENQDQSTGKVLTQEEVDALIADRLKRAKATWEQEEKDKATEAAKPELERWRNKATEFENKFNETQKAIQLRDAKDAVAESARKAGATDTTLIWKAVKDDLEYDSNGKVTNLETALKDTKQLHPHLFKTNNGKADANAGNGNERKPKSNDWMRELAQKS